MFEIIAIVRPRLTVIMGGNLRNNGIIRGLLKGEGSNVLSAVELLLDRRQVHRLFDDVKVVGDAQVDGVHRFVKRLGFRLCGHTCATKV